MTRFVDVPAMAKLIQDIGIAEFIAELADAIEFEVFFGGKSGGDAVAHRQEGFHVGWPDVSRVARWRGGRREDGAGEGRRRRRRRCGGG